jgi:hypothetical protein
LLDGIFQKNSCFRLGSSLLGNMTPSSLDTLTPNNILHSQGVQLVSTGSSARFVHICFTLKDEKEILHQFSCRESSQRLSILIFTAHSCIVYEVKPETAFHSFSIYFIRPLIPETMPLCVQPS